ARRARAAASRSRAIASIRAGARRAAAAARAARAGIAARRAVAALIAGAARAARITRIARPARAIRALVARRSAQAAVLRARRVARRIAHAITLIILTISHIHVLHPRDVTRRSNYPQPPAGAASLFRTNGAIRFAKHRVDEPDSMCVHPLMRFPSPLAPGARVGLVAPAGPCRDAADVDRSIENTRSFGWEPVVGAHAFECDGYLAGSDAHRLDDLNRFAADDTIDAVWCIRGG